MDNTLGNRIEQIRKDKDLKVDPFCLIIGVSSTMYNKYIKNISIPGADIIGKILKNFPEYNMEWLLLGEGEMKKSLFQQAAESNANYNKNGITKNDLKKLLGKMIDEVDKL